MGKFLILLLFWANFALGAIGSTAVWDIRSTATAANVNGCFFVPGAGTDLSTADSASYGFTDLASTNGTTNPCVVTSASHNFVTADEGNALFESAGTNWTTGRYQIVSTSGNAATLDRACGSAASISGGTFKVGGACSNLLDADLEMVVPSNSVYIKGGATYTPGAAIAITTGIGGASTPIKYIGFTTTHGDGASGTARPTVAMAGNAYTTGANVELYNIIFTTTAANGVNLSTNAKVVNCKITNSSTTASRNALNLSSDAFIMGNELISYRGNALNIGNTTVNVVGNYIHDSNVGIAYAGTSTGGVIFNNIIEGNVTTGLDLSAAGVTATMVNQNTFYGAENKLGVGINIATGTTDLRLFNNIFYGFVTGVTHADAAGSQITYSDCNDFSNNTTARTNIAIGATDTTAAPGFGSVTQVTGTNATISGSVLTSSGATFPTFVAGVDFLYLKSGTAGPTFGIYPITSNTGTTITLGIAPGDSATGDHVFQVTQGHNFAVSYTLNAIGCPGSFPGALTTSFLDIGAAQRRMGPR